MPNTLVRVGRNRLHRIGEQLQDPVEVMRAPVVDGAAGDGLMAVPVAAWVRIAADKRLHVEEVADAAGTDDVAERDEIGVPPAALKHRQHAFADRRLVDHAIYLVDSQRKRLLAYDVFACLQSP